MWFNKESRVDVVLGMSWGDEGKGKVVKYFASKLKYDYCLRFNGGHNAGHTVYIDGEKVVTHIVPTGALNKGTVGLIGPGAVLDPDKFFLELETLKKYNPKVLVAKNTHIITSSHKEEDGKDGDKIGTTKTGNGPCYRDKYARTGLRAEDVSDLKEFLFDPYEIFQNKDSKRILAEGAQGFFLDIDWGEYPYVTSSHCGIGGLLNNGLTINQIDEVIGVSKCYDTYVGSKRFQGPETELVELAKLGNEVGSTTGRLRQTNWLNLQNLTKAVKLNSVSTLVINKCDVLQQLGKFVMFDLNGEKKEYQSWDDMAGTILEVLSETCDLSESRIEFSSNPETI